MGSSLVMNPLNEGIDCKVVMLYLFVKIGLNIPKIHMDFVSIGLQLDHKEIPLQQRSGSYDVSKKRDRYGFIGNSKVIVNKKSLLVAF